MAEREWTTADFDYDLPPELIAQEPVPERGTSRLLVVHRTPGTNPPREDLGFADLVARSVRHLLDAQNEDPARGARTRSNAPLPRTAHRRADDVPWNANNIVAAPTQAPASLQPAGTSRVWMHSNCELATVQESAETTVRRSTQAHW